MTQRMGKRLADLDALVLLSEHMLGKARADEWDEIPEMERQRSVFLRAMCAEPFLAEESGEVSRRLEKIRALDQELINLAVDARNSAADQLRQLRQGQRAQAAYGTVQQP